MKTKFTLLIIFVAALMVTASAQQLPNPSFDTWANDTLAPDGWSTYESFYHLQIGHAGKDGVDKFAGPYSLKVTSDSVPGFPSYGVLAGVCALGNSIPGVQPAFTGIAFPYRPDTVFCIYKYTSLSPDSPIIAINLTKVGAAVFGSVNGAALILPPTSAWASGSIPISAYYLNSDVPDTLSLGFYSSRNPQPGMGKKGSVLHVDGIFFSYVTIPSALQEVADQLNVSVYPNPATNVITVATDENIDGFTLVLSDIGGKLISVTNLEGRRTAVDVSELSSGIYIYRFADKTGNILRQDRITIAK